MFFTNTNYSAYEGENLQMSDDEESGKGEWINSKQNLWQTFIVMSIDNLELNCLTIV